MLKLEDVNTYYGNIHALKGISIEIKQGEIACLLGANGAGKSTTLMSISGVCKVSSGKIFFNGQDITNLSCDKIVSMGISQIPEGRRIFPYLTVLENLEIGAFLRNDKKNIENDLENIFTLFPILKERKKQIGGTLSGGEQQMLAIGRGLMARPKLLLLDEPSLGLAPIIIKQIFNIIHKINAQGTTILLVEQNAYAALKLANKGYCLETGHVVLEDSAYNLLNNDMVRKIYLGET
ncbi:MAG: ABC transporter ATP-binding protein [Candidatus Firestonebacteria bacterium]|nr:ABC transporter ATP-binding protein [Candidatus Firestonebacteria bacterium]